MHGKYKIILNNIYYQVYLIHNIRFVNNMNNLTSDPEYFNKWYHSNKDKILKKLKEKKICECGAVIAKSGMKPHMLSNKHKNLMNILRLSNDLKIYKKNNMDDHNSDNLNVFI